MKKNILAENMRRFGTKNLTELNLQDLENKLGFDSGANRDPRTGNLITPDTNQEKDNFLNKINVGSIEFDGIDHKDAPDYVDAYISYAEFEDGTALNDDQLELLSSYNDWWYDILWDRLH